MRLQTVFVLILPFILVLWATPARCSADFDFSAYPASTRTCLEDAADDSTCTADSADEDTNMCLCSNTGNFVLSAAACIGDQGADVLAQVYELMQDDCSDAKTPLTVSEAEWFMAANGTTVTVTSTITTTSAGILTTYTTTSTSSHIASEATATSSSTSSAGGSSSSQGPGQGMTASAEIGAITSSVAGALAIACMVCMFFMFKKRRTDKREMRAALEAGRRIGGGGDRRSNDKPLLSLGAMTPGSRSPLGASWRGRRPWDTVAVANITGSGNYGVMVPFTSVCIGTHEYDGNIRQHNKHSWANIDAFTNIVTPAH
ncbi:hypothetical protein M406DRAFT_325219 [Cryphonectria parasitica EP155]|uniref:Extracellular membrane protein CFEM domain-containing protein n=1 Tax=Cryphonectria parasitica (strain ATCC 38755 / EP155) TaxID=660469 RepID=A0A9P5CTS6_CRYP1|nr:uncharacterized protein M406DRAFT_325219 [Cryphonectria parasitica EP155]KAF3769731.1 hypothetical protein M406DRAFT_325219 [Cryphonectria parasitica EP155]